MEPAPAVAQTQDHLKALLEGANGIAKGFLQIQQTVDNVRCVTVPSERKTHVADILLQYAALRQKLIQLAGDTTDLCIKNSRGLCSLLNTREDILFMYVIDCK